MDQFVDKKEQQRLRKNAYMREWKKKNKGKVNAINRHYKEENRELVRARERGYFDKRATLYYSRVCLSAIRSRAKKKGIPFDLVEADLVVPTHCPVLGIPLVPRSGSFCDNSPSVDRLIPELGYVKGNCRVISYRANRIKCHATIEDLEKILDYMRRELIASRA